MEEELQSLTDQLDALISEMGEGGERPEGIYSAVEQFKTAIQERSEDLKEAVDDIGGGAEVSNAEEGIEEQADRILPDEEFSPEQVLAQELAIEEGLEVEDTIGEEAVDAVESSLETDAAQIGEGFQQIAEDAETLNDVFVALGESSAVSNEALQELQPTFEELQTEVQETIQEVESGAATLSEGQNRIAEISQKAQEALQENIEGQFENVEGVGQELQEVVSKYFENVQTQMGAAGAAEQAGVPGVEQTLAVGGTLQELGDGNVFQGIASAVDTALAPITNPDFQGFNAAMQEAQEEAGGIAAMFSKVKGAISASRVALGAFIAPLIFAVDLVEDAFGAARDFREETGIGAERMRELREVTASTSAELAKFGLSPGDSAEIFGGLQEQFGSLRSAVQLTGAETEEQLVKQVGALSQGFAMSASEAAKLFGTLKEIEMTTGISGNQLATATKEIARQNDVAPKAAMQDIAENSEKLAKFASGSAERLASAAVEAQRLGTSLESVTSFQEQALSDMTGQVQKFQEASMLTGQQFNSQALIQASFEGTDATLDEIRNQLEGIDVENLNYFQKESLADAFGMGVAEIQQISEGQKALQDLNTTAARSKALSEGDVTFQQAVTADDVDEVKQLTKTFNQLYFVMAEELFPVITDLTQAVLPALTATLKFTRPFLEGMAEGVRLILSPLQLLNGNFKGLEQTLNELIKPWKNVFGLMEDGEKKASKLASAGKILATAFAAWTAGSWLVSGISSGIGTITTKMTALYRLARMKGWVDSIKNLGSSIRDVGSKLSGYFTSALDAGRRGASRFAGALRRGKNAVVRFGSKAIDAMPTQAIKNAFSTMWKSSMRFITRIPAMLGTAMSTISSAFYTGMTSAYAFATSLSATGIGAIILGIAAAAGALATAFYGVDETVTYITETFNSFMNTVFNVENASTKLSSALSMIENAIADGVMWYVDNLINSFEALWNYGKNLVSTFYELGTAIAEGRFGDIGGILMDGLQDIGYNLLNVIFPESMADWVAQKMSSLAATIRSYLPFSPAEEGPLTDIDMVGEALIDTIFGDGVFSFAAQKMKELGSTVMDTLSSMGEGVMNFLGLGGGEEESKSKEKSASEMMLESAMITVQNATIQGISGQEGEAAQVNVQSPNVATVDSDVATGPQRAAATSAPAQQPQQQQGETNEIRLDSSEDNVKQILRQILNTQRKFLQELQNGNIAVYLDGRKVNKEIVRSTGFAN